MDMLLTAIALALLCLAAWMLYKRYTARYKAEPVVEEEYDEEPEEPVKVTEAQADSEPETKKEA
jgi:hypothetical protein